MMLTLLLVMMMLTMMTMMTMMILMIMMMAMMVMILMMMVMMMKKHEMKILFQITLSDDFAKYPGNKKLARDSERQRKHFFSYASG